ncbi:MAG: hypothetical protein NVSMB64_23840 [Candidatus Velthaea sp.]
MAGGLDTWAEWKSNVLGLPQAAAELYLRDVESFTPEQVERFFAAGAGAAVRSEDWATSDDAAQAMARFFAWKHSRTATPGTRLEDQEARAAGLPEDTK